MKKIDSFSMAVKLTSIGIIIVSLLLGNCSIKSKLKDRKEAYDYAERTISNSAGGGFLFRGLTLAVPYDEIEEKIVDGKCIRTKKSNIRYFNPSEIKIDSIINTEMRTVGIYSVPVFTGDLCVQGTFTLENLNSNQFYLDKAYFLLQLDETSILSHPEFIINGKSYKTTLKNSGIKSDIVYKPGTMTFSTAVKIRGARNFFCKINGEDTKLTIKSNWPSPGFTESYLPNERTLSEDGFEASWNLPFNSGYSEDLLGFSLVDSVNVYKKLDRAINYGFLFIIVPFIALFLFELFTNLNLNPLQYLLSGAASVVFFLLLLAFSEHINFGWAYLISSIASGLLISVYVASIARKAFTGLTLSGVFGGLYGYLYFSLKSEDNALLIGSLFAFFIIAVLMYFTRNEKLFNIKKIIPENKIENSNC